MHFQFIVAPPTPGLTPPSAPSTDSTADLLRQILEVQREQLAILQAPKPQEPDANLARWKNFFDRWHEEFPDLPAAMIEALPAVERAFLRLMDDMTRFLKEEETCNLENEFTLSEFLDRYAVKASQIAGILNLLGQMAEAGRQQE
jgi:hypothetical protein